MIRLKDLGSAPVALEWHEAVAVVAALTTAAADLDQAPALDAAGLTANGDIVIDGDRRQPGTVTCGLAATLCTLLESTPCPAELRQVVSSAREPDGEPDTIAGFAQALMFFERPGREQILRDLGVRAGPALQRARVSAALERLTERARQHAEQVPPETEEPEATASARRLIAPAAVGMTVFIAVAVAVATLFTTAQAPDRSLTAVPSPVDEPAPHDGGGSGVRRPPDPVERASAERPRSAPGPSRHSGGTAAAPAEAGRGSTSTDPGRAATPDVVVRVTELGGGVLPQASAAVSTSADARGQSSRVYTSADAGVSPAILIKPHLPAEPPEDVPPWQVGTLELTIGTTGAVEQVRLISPYNRYQERMLVAAAKAWLFQPATRDGRPVRFRARVRVTL